MRGKTADFFYAFCISAGGISLALLYPVDLATTVILTALSVVAGLLFTRLDTDLRRDGFLSVGALFSSAVSLYLGTTLVCEFALDNSFYPICLLLSFIVAIAISLSSSRASKSVACVISVFAIILLLIILLLCILEGDFSCRVSVTNDKKILFPLAVFSVLDILFVLPHIKKQNRLFCAVGLTVMPLYLFVTVLITLFTLAHNVNLGAVTPIIRMWQTCYLASFVDRFETLVICAMFAINVLKAGMLLKTAVCKIKKYFLIIPPFLAILLMVKPSFIYLFAVITVFFAFIYFLFKKTY